MKKNIVFLDSSTFPDHLKFNKIKFTHTWKNHKTTSPSEVINRIKNANIIVNNKVDLGPEKLIHARKLELIALTATGTNIIDLEYCQRNNIEVYKYNSIICILVSILIIYFPLIPSGNFFNNWVAGVNFFIIGFGIYAYNLKNLS